MEKRDLLVRFDEEAETLEFFSVRRGSKNESIALDNPKPHLELTLSQLRAMGPDEAERRVGAGALVFLDFHGYKPTLIRDYQALGARLATEEDSRLTQAAMKGDPAAQFELAQEYLDRSIRFRRRPDLDLAKKWLESAASLGSTDAQQFLKAEWERSKSLAERRIADAESEKD